jgi:tetratricopeptide (TPR) repeat protein
MGEIVKFPGQPPKLGYKRVRKKAPENPGQLVLFSQPTAEILEFAAGLSGFERALLYDERGDARAGELYRKAIEENDCAADAYCNLGIIESKEGNSTKAFDCFTMSLKQNPRHAEAHYNLGNLYFDLNDFRLAQNHYEMAATVEPSFANVYFNLALVLTINNEIDAAVAALATYEKFVPREEARRAGELLEALQKSLAAAQRLQHRSP